ncbi:MAG TPA: potassium-transporting ATPase subunit KdpC [Steroidobacteraceae bacterium]|nr:potassium-transporting ATPase subunit KdpC [Steroidobacteraceae bacterium]
MNTRVNSIIRPAVTLFLIMTVLLGVVYPFAVTGLSQLLFHDQAAGSLVVVNGKAVGSRIIGQSFSEPKYFWSRPSATASQPYNAIASSGSNLGPLNPALTDAVGTRIATLKAADPTNTLPVPVDLVTASASGLDPDISIAAARYQAARVARIRGLDPAAVRSLIDVHARGKLFGLVGEPRVNVLELNLALDALSIPNKQGTAGSPGA